MKRRYNPADGQLVAGILTDPRHDHDPDPLIMAERIVRELNTKRERERLFAVPLITGGRLFAIYGPYTGMRQAHDDVAAGGVVAPAHGTIAQCLPLIPTTTDPDQLTLEA